MVHDYTDDQMPHKKKKPSSKSKSKQRSDHKHIYEKIICVYIDEPAWADRCKACGRIVGRHGILRSQDLYETIDSSHRFGITRHPLSFENLRKKFPGIDIYKADWQKDENGNIIYELDYTLLKE